MNSIFPTRLTAKPEPNSVTLSWQSVTSYWSVIKYVVQYSTDNLTWTTFITEDKFTSCIATIPSLTEGVTYYFRVRAIFNGNGNTGPNSAVVSAVPLSLKPTEPVDVVAAVATRISNDNSIMVSWKEPKSIGGSPIQDYIIQYSSNSGSTWSTSFTVPPNVFQYTFNGLVKGTTYIFKVLARNSFGFGKEVVSQPIVCLSLPSSPLNFKATYGDGCANASWTPPVDNGGAPIYRYLIQCAGFDTRQEADSWGNDPLVNATPNLTPKHLIPFSFINNNTTSITVPGLKNGLFYALRIRAFNSITPAYGMSFSSPFSNKFIVRPKSLPGKPTNLVVARAGKGTVSLSWEAPTNTGGLQLPILNYVVQYSDGNTWTTVDRYSNTTGVTVSGLTNGQPYFFRVAAQNIVGVGFFSDNSSAIIPGSVPNAPTLLSSIGYLEAIGSDASQIIGRGFIKLSWSPPDDDGGLPIISYQISLNSQQFGTRQITVPPTTSYIVTLKDLNIDAILTKNVFSVAATNTIGQGPYSNRIRTIAGEITSPKAPKNLAATATRSSAVLKWDAPDDNGGSVVTSYRIQQSSDSGSTWTTVVNATTNAVTTFTVTNLTNNTSYIFRVAAINSVGVGTYSSNSNSVIPLEPPVLFDNSTIEARLQVWVDAGVIRSVSPWKEYIYAATARLGKYIKYKASVINSIRADIDPSWNGAAPVDIQFFYDDSVPYIAFAGVASYADIYDLSGVQANTIYYTMSINTYYATQYTNSNWIDIITHELCHALGLGVFWVNNNFISGSIPASNYFLNGSSPSGYVQTQNAYNSITGLSRNLIPLESSGASSTASKHWENGLRPAANGFPAFYGFVDEIMIGYAPNPRQSRVLSKLTLKHFVDLGYEEINPNTSEGNPIVNTVSVYSISDHDHSTDTKMNCDHPSLPKPQSILKINLTNNS